MNIMKRRDFVKITGMGLSMAIMPEFLNAVITSSSVRSKPNIIFILADDMAHGDLGCFGQKKIKTPNIDRMAKEGIRFTQLYTGTSVCAPSRASLMTGLNMGHCPIRANREIKPEGQMPLPGDVPTVAEVLKSAGYATACTGKWGLGMFDTTGSPLKKGFDHFFGYNCQRHAHSYFPSYLYSDDKRIELDGKTYSQNLIADDTFKWVRAHSNQPFFLFAAWTLPHAKYEIDDLGEYASTDWNTIAKTYAAMVSRFDRDVGRLIELIKELKLDEKTVIFLSVGDNGPQFAPDSETGKFFEEATEKQFRGFKRTMYEGGFVRWPGQVPAGKVSDEPWAFWDFLPTCAELAGAKLPDNVKTDGLSVVSAIMGGRMPERPYFYWELHEPHFMQATRFDNWKAVRPELGKPVELYNLKTDPGEQNDLAAKNPEIVAKAEEILKTARVDSPDWPMKPAKRQVKKEKGQGKTARQ
ncbi:MAG: arylsulfatase [Kiritimatiellae bacterium]|nr:arylsulfatase [Kiritimatiellia bacterium]